jgi:hypothetical protein
MKDLKDRVSALGCYELGDLLIHILNTRPEGFREMLNYTTFERFSNAAKLSEVLGFDPSEDPLARLNNCEEVAQVLDTLPKKVVLDYVVKKMRRRVARGTKKGAFKDFFKS